MTDMRYMKHERTYAAQKNAVQDGVNESMRGVMEEEKQKLRKRIIFLNPFSSEQISGGIKTTFLHAEALFHHGYEILIHSVSGVPKWLDKGRFEHLIIPHESLENFAVTRNDILVFPEVLRDWVAELVEKPLPCKKIIFCQNQYILYTTGYNATQLKSFGVEKIITVGETAKQGILSILGDALEIEIIPPCVNEKIFFPQAEKQLKILAVGRKWRDEGYMGYIQRLFIQKYPHIPHIPWVELDNMTEAQTAQAMKDSAICLFLGRLEACPLTALEAMSCGCLLVGFHGGGGRDYAHEENGFWYSPEDLIGVVDALYKAVRGLLEQDPKIWQIINNGYKISQDYYTENVREKLCQLYDSL